MINSGRVEPDIEEKNITYKNNEDHQLSQKRIQPDFSKNYLYDFKFEEPMNFLCYFPNNNLEEIIKTIKLNYRSLKSLLKKKKMK